MIRVSKTIASPHETLLATERLHTEEHCCQIQQIYNTVLLQILIHLCGSTGSADSSRASCKGLPPKDGIYSVSARLCFPAKDVQLRTLTQLPPILSPRRTAPAPKSGAKMGQDGSQRSLPWAAASPLQWLRDHLTVLPMRDRQGGGCLHVDKICCGPRWCLP